VPAYIDAIIAARPSACNKVTLVPHSTAVNAVLVAAAGTPLLSEKVDLIAAVAPCLEVNTDNFWYPAGDIISADMLY
jgi:hypothetical protein